MISISYSYTDLAPLLEKAQKSSEDLSQKAYTLNVGRKALPKEPEQRRETLPEMADGGNLLAKRQVRKTINEIEKGLNEHEKFMQQYKDETDKRNAILNRMGHLRGVMRDWANSDAKNKIAGLNMVIESINEYGKLKQEADKFLKYIKQ